MHNHIRYLLKLYGIDDSAKLARRAGIAYATAHYIWFGPPDKDKAKGTSTGVLEKVAKGIDIPLATLFVTEETLKDVVESLMGPDPDEYTRKRFTSLLNNLANEINSHS